MTIEFGFTLHGTDGPARHGTVHTLHGDIRTPAFMPVGTVGTVKGLYLDQVEGTGADIILGNTYHLMLRPGAEEVAKLGGLHKFIGWKRPILTDSGGFQIMSLSKIRKITEQAAMFQSHIDGRKYELSPERAMEIQRLLGSDIQMQLDQCIEYPHTEKDAEKAMQLSLRWAERSRKAFGRQPGRGNFGIVQGGINPKLRKESAEGLKSIGFEGYAIGGLAVGEGHDLMLQAIEHTIPHLPEDRPRYLMGVGTPEDILESVARGIDMFDCVLPTRSGRHGQAFTRFGKINLRNAKHAGDPRPLDAGASMPGAVPVFAGLSAPPHEIGRTAGDDAALLGQHRLLSDASCRASARPSPKAASRTSALRRRNSGSAAISRHNRRVFGRTYT